MDHKTILLNEYVSVIRFNDSISWSDLTDKWNDYRGFTRNKRGLDKAQAYLEGLAPEVKKRVRMGDITGLMASMKLKPHTFCGMD